jgi:hypothetical protein
VHLSIEHIFMRIFLPGFLTQKIKFAGIGVFL